MAELRINREYKLKFYLNARHYIYINGVQGETHPHTWEFTLYIKFGQDGFVEFSDFEKGVNAYLATYQNCVMNDVAPFNVVMPTLENIADYFTRDIYEIIGEIGGKLTRIEASETPTRSYILRIDEDHEFSGITVAKNTRKMAEVVDAVLDEALEMSETYEETNQNTTKEYTD